MKKQPPSVIVQFCTRHKNQTWRRPNPPFARRWGPAFWSALLIMVLLVQPVLALIVLEDDFDPNVDNALWAALNNAAASTACGAVNGNALYFDGAGTRSAATIDLNVSNGGLIGFGLRIGTGAAPCEDADANEGVTLQYSTNGGTTWTNIQTYGPDSFAFFLPQLVTIPAGAQTTSTRFRWVQANNSGVGFDNWAIDNVVVDANQSPVNTVPGPQTTNEDTPLTFSSANGNQISISDPDAGTNQVDVTLNVTNGALTLSGVAGLTFSAGDGLDDPAMTFQGTIAAINAALNGLRFDPTPGYNGPATLTIVTNDLGHTGAGVAGSDSDTVDITVNLINDAPVLTPILPILPPITEDDLANGGQLVSAIVGSSISDADIGAVEGIAIYGLNSGNGTWEYSTDGGGSWSPVGAVTTGSALLLADNHLVRFVPNGENGTLANFSYYAWDRTAGTAGSTVDASSRGNATAFSLASDTASITVTSVNDAPVLDNSGQMGLTSLAQNDFTNLGDPVSDIIASAGGDRITDVDNGAVEGIAVIAADNSYGDWQYSLNSGLTWVSFGTPSNATARLLAADGLTRVRFVPDPFYFGAVDPGITFLAWDETSGSNGVAADASTNGGVTAFSTASETAGIAVAAETDLSLSKQAPATATAGGPIVYTLDVTNNGPSGASAVIITDTLPTGLTFDSASPSICTAAGSTVVCNLAGSLDSGDSASLSLTALVGSGLAGSAITNQAVVSAAQPDPVPANNSDSAGSTVTALADLGLVKQGPATAYAGGYVTYTLRIANTGPSVASAIVVTDTLPAGVSFVGATPSICTPSGSAVVCNLAGSLAVGGSSSVTLTALVDSGLVGLPIVNQALVRAGQPDPNPANNSDSVSSLTIALADVAISKEGPATATAGGQIVYTIHLTNTGPSVATLLDISDNLPAGVQLSSASATRSGGGAVQCAGPTCRLTNLAVGEIVTMNVTGVVLPGLPDGLALTNIASLSSSTPDPDATNDSASVVTTVSSQADLQLTKTDLTDPVDLAESFLYELVAINLGPSDAQNVVLSDTLDSRLIFQGASQGCTYSGGVVTCNVGTLAANSSDRYLISVVPNNVVSGTILSNSAGISAATAEANPADNQAGPITTTVVQKPGTQADLSLAKQTNQATIYAGGIISYTIVATNAGPADATSVWLQELVPFGTTVMHLTADNPAATGEFCSLSGLCYLGTLPVGRVATVTVELLLDDDYRQPDLTNQAHVSASQTDPDPHNNLASVTTPVVAPGCAARINNLLPIYLTPQAAVDVAQPGDTIKVAGYCAGVHSRGGFLQSVYINEPLTIRGGYTLTNWLDSDPATHPATIDAVGGGRVLYLTGAGVHVNVENLNLTGGSYLAGLGGGIFIAGGANATSADISGTRIYSNTADVGGGLYAAGTVSLTATEIVSNTAPGNAGGAYLAGPTNITNSRIAYNESLIDGGGLYGAGSLDLTNSDIEANRAVRGGGLYAGADLVMSGTEFNGNQANIDGGGAYVSGSTTLTGGHFEGNTAVTDEGGGLFSHGRLTVTGAHFIGNESQNGGGGVFVDADTSASIQDAYFESNSSRERGGGLAVDLSSSLAMTNTHFISNTVVSDDGGGVNVWGGPAAITGCRFENNRCLDNDCNGGGLYVLDRGTTLSLARSEFTGNQAGNNGGGLYTGNTLVMTTTQLLDNQTGRIGGGVYAGNGIDMANSLLLGNQAGNNGGGLYLEAGSGRLVNDILARNSATNDGAGLYLNSLSQVDIIHTTLANPTPAAGEAIYANRGAVSVINTIVTSYTTAIQRASGTVFEDYNLFFGNGADLNGTINSGGHSVTGFPPDFADPAADDYYLQPTSMAIDLGEHAGVANDYDFNPRPAPISPYLDAGAYEYSGQVIDLSLTKTAAETLIAGEVLTYSLTVDNLGPSKARQLVLTDTLPAGVTLSRIITSTGSSCLAGPNPITCTIPLLPANDSISFTIVVTSDSTLEPGARLVNRAGVRSAMNETNWANNLATAVTIIVDRADLVLEKRGPATVTAGMPVTYTVVATNTGPSLARSVNLADYLPTGTTLQAITVARSDAGTTFCGGASCQLGSMAVGEVVTMTVVALVGPDVSPGSMLTNAAGILSPMTVDPNPANNNASQTSLVETLADLALAKIDLADPVGPTTNFLYELTVTNAGPSTARGLVITDTLDANTTFATASAGCTFRGGQVVCQAGTLAAGSTTRYQIGVVAGDVVSGTVLTNVATVAGSTPDPASLNNSDIETTTVQQQFGPSADVQLSKSVSAPTVVAGGRVTYTLTVSNAGPLAATGVVVMDYLPSGVDLVDVSASNPDYPYAFCALNGTCYLGLLGLNRTAHITLVAHIDPAYQNDSLTNIATVTANEVDYFGDNNIASATVTITDTTTLSLTKIALADPTAAGQLLMYELNVTNNGPALARQVLITDAIPASTTFVGASNDCIASDGQMSCQMGDLAAGADMSAWVQVRVDPGVISGTLITNTAFVSAANSPGSSATETTRVATVPSVDLTLSKTGPTTASSGEQIAFTILVTNTGPIAVPFVYIQDNLPAGLTFDQMDVVRSGIGLISCTDLTCQIDNMVVDEVVTATVTAIVASGLANGTVLTNTAVVSSSVVDYNPANNGDSHPVTIINSLSVYLPLITKAGSTNLPDLVGSFSLTPDKTSYSAGESVLITAVVVNQGNAVADGFWVDFYINPARTPAVNVRWSDICSLSPCYGLAWYVEDLAPGESAVLTSTPNSYEQAHSRWEGQFAPGASDLYLYVDSWNPTVATGGVLESNESNNRAERRGLTVSGLEPSGVDVPTPLEVPPRPVRLDR